MGNREWRIGNGEWGMRNGEWGIGDGEWGMGNEKIKWKIENFFQIFFFKIYCL